MPFTASPPLARPSFALTAVISAVLAGCTVGPDFRSPPAPASTRYTEAPPSERTAASATPGGTAQRLGPDRDIPGEWWELFHSQQISTLVTQALKANPDVAAAQATLRQARETTRAEQGALFPSVGVTAQAERQRESLAAFGIGSESATFTTYGANLNIAYTLDAFGGVR